MSVSRWTKTAGFHVLTYQAYWENFNAGPRFKLFSELRLLKLQNVCSIPQKIYKFKF
jgi:hypothetical protein